jgi:hypothetical protein
MWIIFLLSASDSIVCIAAGALMYKNCTDYFSKYYGTDGYSTKERYRYRHISPDSEYYLGSTDCTGYERPTGQITLAFLSAIIYGAVAALLLVFLRDRHEKCKREAKARAAEQARLLGL